MYFHRAKINDPPTIGPSPAVPRHENGEEEGRGKVGHGKAHGVDSFQHRKPRNPGLLGPSRVTYIGQTKNPSYADFKLLLQETDTTR
jgi:hypothetical protein